MPQAGGSATIYGVLYQILGAIHWAASIRLKATREGDELAEASLIIEPVGGGGDIRIESKDKRIVEQWKAKSDRSTWSLRDVINDVLPDLYRAVDASTLERPCEYRFVTEGRRGRWKEAEKFFRELNGKPVPTDPVSTLDNKRSQKKKGHSRRALFLRIARQMHARNAASGDSKEVVHRKLWHLLGGFQLVPLRTIDTVQSEVNRMLLNVVNHREELDAKRRELCGLILDLASEGEVQITPQEFLQRGGIDVVPFSNWREIQVRLHNRLQRVLELEFGYLQNDDVRKSPVWPADRPVLIFTGESGQGKTWQLGALGWYVGQDGLAVAVTATGDADRDLALAADAVCKYGLGRDTSISLDRITERWREFIPGRSLWLTVLVDDVLSAIEAHRLITIDCENMGVRLGITTSPAIATSMEQRFPSRVAVIQVEDFNVLELQSYLERRGQQWGSLPFDVRKLLKRPLLARLYCDIAGSSGWTPTYEYDLFERFWLRIGEARSQPDHPGDLGLMITLADSLLDAGTAYPWVQQLLASKGLDDAAQRRLEIIGWLRRVENARVEISHDRLLNWAIAEALVERRITERISTEELGIRLAELAAPDSTVAGRYAGYVPMDVLWLISDPSRVLGKEVPDLIDALENAVLYRPYAESLYRDLLPTLGTRIVPALIDRVCATVGHDFNPYPKFASDAILEIAEKTPGVAHNWGVRLVGEEVSEVREVGMRVLARYPHNDAIERLWQLHIASVRICETKPEN